VSYDRGRQRWIGRVWLDGRRHSVSATTKEECARKLGALVHGDVAHRRADKKASVGGILTDWSTSALPNRRLAPATLDAYRWALDTWRAELGSRRAADLRVEDVERALGRLARRSKLSRSSLVKLRSVLSQVMAWAVRRGTIVRNPVDGAELPTDAAPSRQRRALTAAQLRKLLSALDDHPRQAMYLVMATVGLRPGEASALCADAVDVDAGTVTVRRAIHLERGRPRLADALKTKSSHRTIGLPAVATDALRDHVAVTGATGADLLFPADDGGPLWPSTVRGELADLGERIGVGPIRPNELRHTAATLLVDHLPLHQVADILGHSSVRMLDATYRHRPAVIRGAAVLDGALSR
jgi:integrase